MGAGRDISTDDTGNLTIADAIAGVSGGNPQLEPLESWNADLSFEWYPKEGDLVSFAKANPGKLKFAHSGNWGATHTPALQLFKESGIGGKITMVPYKGGGPSMRGFLAGEADFTMQFKSTGRCHFSRPVL